MKTEVERCRNRNNPNSTSEDTMHWSPPPYNHYKPSEAVVSEAEEDGGDREVADTGADTVEDADTGVSSAGEAGTSNPTETKMLTIKFAFAAAKKATLFDSDPKTTIKAE